VIEAAGLARSFAGRPAVRDASFAVARGEIVGFLGPNGAGKTTTIRMLLGVLRPDAGSARIDGTTGYLPELFAAYDALTVAAYLRFLARMKQVDRDDVDRVMAATDLTDLSGRPVTRLSKGQRQRVGLAQALLGRPDAYVLDEPTQGLDPSQVVEVRAQIAALARDEGAAVLLSTHLLAEAAALCDRVVVIAAGRVVADEPTGDAADLEARFLRLVGEAELS
jgi:ABC-2 type transport system ATP-binding protein